MAFNENISVSVHSSPILLDIGGKFIIRAGPLTNTDRIPGTGAKSRNTGMRGRIGGTVTASGSARVTPVTEICTTTSETHPSASSVTNTLAVGNILTVPMEGNTRTDNLGTPENPPNIPTNGTIHHTRDGSKCAEMTLKLCSFNCKGLKQSSDYIVDLFRKNDVLCLTETWLRPHELGLIEGILTSYGFTPGTFSVFNKSSMNDVDAEYKGRPFGGIAIICKTLSDFNFHEIETQSVRTLAVAMRDKYGNTKQTLVNVYMPYYDRSNPEQTDRFIEVIDLLQSFIDTHGMACPLKCFGDFNVQLPRLPKLNRLWYKSKGFNQHSSILFDFLCANNLLSADFLFPQSLDYTYFSCGNNTYTWLDHVFTTAYDADCVTTCKILDLVASNVSDHLPIYIQKLF